jgi:hypothetical protein
MWHRKLANWIDFFEIWGLYLTFFKKLPERHGPSFNFLPENINFKKLSPKIDPVYGACLRVFSYFFVFVIL